MERKNQFSKELMHKTIVEDTIVTPDSEWREMMNRIKLKARAAEGDSSALKRYANAKWYEEHKQWKKQYNQKYYRDHKDYWQKRYNYYQQDYKYAHDDLKRRNRVSNEAADEARAARLKYGENSDEYRKAQERADWHARQVKEASVELKTAKTNLDRAIKDNQWYQNNTKHMKVTDAWLDGTKQIRDAGKKHLKKMESIGSKITIKDFTGREYTPARLLGNVLITAILG